MAGKIVFPVGSLGSKHAPPEATPVGVVNAPGPPFDIPVTPPGNSHTAKTSEPVLPLPNVLNTNRSPAESPLPLASRPDCNVTGWPVWVRNTDPNWYPFRTAFSQPLSVFAFGIS